MLFSLSRMKRFGCLVLACLLCSCHQPSQPATAVDFSLPNVRGGVYDFRQNQGRALLLAFLQTQPDTGPENPSRAMVPALLSMDHQYHTFGLDTVIVDATTMASGRTGSATRSNSSGTSEPLQAPRKFPSMDALLNTSYDWSLSVPLLADPDGKVARQYHVDSVPTMILVDANGHIGQRWTTPLHPGNLAAGIQQLMGGPMAKHPLLRYQP